MKTCKKCGIQFDTPYCKPCDNRRSAEYRAKNPERVKENLAAWSIKNSDKKKSDAAVWYRNNSDITKSRSVEWRKSNPEKAASSRAKHYIILPLALGGKNEDRNTQLLHSTCNLRKSSKHPIDFMQSRGFLC